MTSTPLLEQLTTSDDATWAEVRSTLRSSIHEVDRNATDIWFAFFPFVLSRALDRAADPAKLVRQLALLGRYRLADQIDSSHTFLYGHRYWPQAKAAVRELALADRAQDGALADVVRTVAQSVAASAKVAPDLVTGISAVALATLAQVGLEAFSATPGSVSLDAATARRSPDEVLKRRAREQKPGLLGLLRSIDHRYTVTFDENREECTFPAVNGQDLTMAGANDTRDHASADPRCVEGPIPIECRTAACGTCWIGVLGGETRMSDVEDREWRKMKEFGYLDSDDPQPIIRLACRTKVSGPVSIVIPPWNGVFGKLIEGKIDVEGSGESE